MTLDIDITELEVGNFVVSIVEQQGSFCLSKPGHIKSPAVIKNLKSKGVKTLRVDPSKQLSNGANSLPLEKADKKSTSAQQVREAKILLDQSKNISREVFKQALNDENFDLAPVADITNKTIDQIFENPDALACIINIREKDDYLLEHSVAVSVLVSIFAKHLELNRKTIHQLSIGAFLHDVGKIKIPDSILNKPGRLTEDEFDIMKGHVNHSIDIINNTPGIDPLSLEVAAQHHEKLDGKGYPFSLPAEEITQYGRMISICDIFDALTANRCYKDGYPHVKAFSILRHLAKDGQLDAGLVDAFIKCMGVFPVGSLVELNSSRLAIVETRNDADPTNPKVRSFYDPKEHSYVETCDVNLAEEEDFIVKAVRADDFDLDMNKIIQFLSMEG